MWPFKKTAKNRDIHERRLAAFGPIVIVSSMCIGPNRLHVKHGIREESRNVSDSGWILASGKESKEFTADPHNYKLVPLDLMIETDATLSPLRDWPVGTEITRRDVSEPWCFIVNDQVVDEDGKVVGKAED